MQAPQRQRHFRLWVVLGVLIPLGLALALILRPEMPLTTAPTIVTAPGNDS